MKIQAMRNYTEDTGRRAILVEVPFPDSRGWAKKLNRGSSPLAKITALGAIILLISAAAYLGLAAYREVEQARRLNEGQDRRLAQLEEQISRNGRQLSSLAQSNKDLLVNFSLSAKLSNDFSNGVCLISGSYVFIDPDTGLPLRGMKNPKGESGEAEQPQFTTGGSGEIAEVFYTGTGFHVGDGYLLTNRHVVFEPWKYDVMSNLFSKIISVQPRLVKLEAFFPGRRRSYQLTVKRASSRDDGEAKRLMEQYGEEGPSLLNQLARRNIVKPLTSQGHVMDLYEDRIVYDAASGEGCSGAPVFGQSGRVIGIHFGYFEQNRLSNYAVPIGHGLALLRQAGWEPEN